MAVVAFILYAYGRSVVSGWPIGMAAAYRHGCNRIYFVRLSAWRSFCWPIDMAAIALLTAYRHGVCSFLCWPIGMAWLISLYLLNIILHNCACPCPALLIMVTIRNYGNPPSVLSCGELGGLIIVIGSLNVLFILFLRCAVCTITSRCVRACDPCCR